MSNTAAPERGSIDTARAAWSSQRHDENASRREAVQAIMRSGVTTLGGIAKALQARGIRTPSGVTTWHRAQVARLIADGAVSHAGASTPHREMPAERSTKVSMPTERQTSTNLNRPQPVTGSDASAPAPSASANKQLNGHSTEKMDSAPLDSVPVEITADHVFLPTGEDGNVGPGWENAGETERVKQGRRLQVPRAMANWLNDRRQAVILPPGAPIPPYVRPGTPQQP